MSTLLIPVNGFFRPLVKAIPCIPPARESGSETANRRRSRKPARAGGSQHIVKGSARSRLEHGDVGREEVLFPMVVDLQVTDEVSLHKALGYARLLQVLPEDDDVRHLALERGAETDSPGPRRRNRNASPCPCKAQASYRTQLASPTVPLRCSRGPSSPQATPTTPLRCSRGSGSRSDA